MKATLPQTGYHFGLVRILLGFAYSFWAALIARLSVARGSQRARSSSRRIAGTVGLSDAPESLDEESGTARLESKGFKLIGPGLAGIGAPPPRSRRITTDACSTQQCGCRHLNAFTLSCRSFQVR